jgi:hypothetical protein
VSRYHERTVARGRGVIADAGREAGHHLASRLPVRMTNNAYVGTSDREVFTFPRLAGRAYSLNCESRTTVPNAGGNLGTQATGSGSKDSKIRPEGLRPDA